MAFIECSFNPKAYRKAVPPSEVVGLAKTVLCFMKSLDFQDPQVHLGGTLEHSTSLVSEDFA